MATVQPWTPMMNEKIWTEEEKEEWLAAHGDAPPTSSPSSRCTRSRCASRRGSTRSARSPAPPSRGART